MQNWSISKRGTLAAGLLTVLAVTGAGVAAQAPVLEPRPAVERQTPPLISPPGAQRSEPVRPAPPQQRPGAMVVGPAGSETVPFRAPVLEGPNDGTVMPAAPDSLSAVVLQLQQLQQEVMMLRGTVESQQHTIARLEREQRERYLDLDRRLARGGAAAAEPLADAYAPLDPDAGVTGSADERSAYEEAFALTRERDFTTAISRFRDLIRNFPGGAYEANSWYWLGELHLALAEPDLEESRQAFVQVLERWPDHHKVPDALYKLGVVYHQLDEPEQARRYLQRVRSEFAGSSAARLATGYLERI